MKRWHKVRALEVVLWRKQSAHRMFHLSSPGEDVTLTKLGLSDEPLRIAGVESDGTFVLFIPDHHRGWITRSEITEVIIGPQLVTLQGNDAVVLIWSKRVRIKAEIILVPRIIRIRAAVLLTSTVLLAIILLVTRLPWVR